MEIKQDRENNRTVIEANNVVIDIIITEDGRVITDIYPYDKNKPFKYFINNESGKNIAFHIKEPEEKTTLKTREYFYNVSR